MDPTRFDALTLALGRVRGRRHLISLAAALPVVSTLTSLLPGEAEAERPHERLRRRNDAKRRKRRHRKHHHHQNTTKGGGGGNGSGNGGGGNQPGSCTANGDACQRDSDCCGGNCFGQVCSASPQYCDNVTCNPDATGCCTSGCCYGNANQCNLGGECCAPNCAGKQCGADGCGGSGTCGRCEPGQTCSAAGQCQGSCVPACTGKHCGPDGCGGMCGTCPTGQTCDATGQCSGPPACPTAGTCAAGFAACDSSGGECVCFGRPAEEGGATFCGIDIEGELCENVPPCTKSADCPAGWLCAASTCCSDTPVCILLCPIDRLAG